MVLTKEIFFHYGRELKVAVNRTTQKEQESLKLEAELQKSEENGLKTLAFCCLSLGVQKHVGL